MDKILVMVFRRSSGLRPINTLKHVVDLQDQIASGSQTEYTLAIGVENPVTTDADGINIGSSVRHMFVNIQVVNDTNAVGTINNAYLYFFLNPGGNIVAGSRPAVNAVGASDSRKLVFHQEMAMLSDASDSIPITLFKGVLKIPRKGSRIGVNDIIGVRIGTPTAGAVMDICIQCIYKEIR